jgi:DNA-binding beta-propeller fold protein YncE
MNIERMTAVQAAAKWAGLCLLILCVAAGAQSQTAPRYRFDPDWPKAPLPNKWWMQGVTGLAVDKDDNIWVLTRPNDLSETENYAALNPPTAECCVAPPAIIAFDQQGNVINSFAARQGHGMVVDSQGFVWIGSNTVRKYRRDGQQVGEIARVPENQPGGGADNAAARAAFRAKYPADTKMIVGGIEEVRADDAVREIYVIDNYLNGRVLVFDMDTLAFKRGWGAYGKPLAEISLDAETAYDPKATPAKDFLGHVTVQISNDGHVYAADRQACRIQVYTKQGQYVKEFIVAPETLDRGSAGGIAFSADPQQRFMFISDIQNNTIWILTREDGKLLGRIGSAGDNGGLFHGLHMIATDSRGNIYTGEVQNGERVQRFLLQN